MTRLKNFSKKFVNKVTHSTPKSMNASDYPNFFVSYILFTTVQYFTKKLYFNSIKH